MPVTTAMRPALLAGPRDRHVSFRSTSASLSDGAAAEVCGLACASIGAAASVRARMRMEPFAEGGAAKRATGPEDSKLPARYSLHYHSSNAETFSQYLQDGRHR